MKKLFQGLSAYIKQKSRQLFKYRVIIAGVVFFSAPIWVMDQGQDLLINSNSRDAGVVLLVALIMMAAFLNWYLAKLFFDDDFRGPYLPVKTPQPQLPKLAASEKKISRFLGVMTIILPAVAILNAQKAIKIQTAMSMLPPALWLIIFLALFFFLIRSDIICKIFTSLSESMGVKRMTSIVVVILAVLGLIIPLLIKLMVGRQFIDKPYSLIYLFWHLILLAFCFVIFVSIREKLPLPAKSLLISRIGLPILISGLILTLIFLAANIFPLDIPEFLSDYIALPVLLSGLVFYTLLFTLLIRMGKRLNINFILFLFVVLTVCATVIPNNFHRVRQIPVKTETKLLILQDYFRAWLSSRKPELDKVSEYPVFMVNSYGGGIRAAAFTSMTMSYLNREVLQKDTVLKKDFEHYVFSISGASGGTIGGAVECASRKGFIDHPAEPSRMGVNDFYSHDFLTPVISALLGRDAWASFLGQPIWDDRSCIQEKLWAKKAASCGFILDNEFESYWDSSSSNPARWDIPLLFSNSLNVDDGLKGIFAPVKLSHEDFPAAHFIRDALDRGKSLSLITAGFLSARFPLISPSGKFDSGYHYMDGGGKDNSGATTSANIFFCLLKYIQDVKKSQTDTAYIGMLDKIHFYFVSIGNSSHVVQETRRRVSNRFEIVSPLVGILNSGIDGNARAADSALRTIYGGGDIQFAGLTYGPGYMAVWPTITAGVDSEKMGFVPLLPLGWQISDSSLSRLGKSFESPEKASSPNDLEKILNIFPVKPVRRKSK